MADSRLIDPLGRHMTLHDRTWFGHVIKFHPELVEYRDEVEQSIIQPDDIVFSTSDSACRMYHRQSVRRGRIIVTVVDLEGGFVKTAHFVKTARKGRVEWSAQKPSKG